LNLTEAGVYETYEGNTIYFLLEFNYSWCLQIM